MTVHLTYPFRKAIPGTAYKPKDPADVQSEKSHVQRASGLHVTLLGLIGVSSQMVRIKS